MEPVHATSGPDTDRLAIRVGLGMLAVNATLCLTKVIVGWRGGSYALIADGVNNLTDVGLSMALVFGIRWARRPADRRHPYGHGKMETEIARLVGILILVTAGGIAIGAWRGLGVRHPPPSRLVILVAAIAMFVKEAMFRVQRNVARRCGSLALEADAINHRSDAAATLAVLLGTVAVWIGGERFALVDDIAALIVAGLMAYGAAQVVWMASREMLDEMPPRDILDAVRDAAMQRKHEGVRGVEKILGRKMGQYYVLDLHLEVPPQMPVLDAHFLGHRVRDTILTSVPRITDVLVHIEPHGHRNESETDAPLEERSTPEV